MRREEEGKKADSFHLTRCRVQRRFMKACVSSSVKTHLLSFCFLVVFFLPLPLSSLSLVSYCCVKKVLFQEASRLEISLLLGQLYLFHYYYYSHFHLSYRNESGM